MSSNNQSVAGYLVFKKVEITGANTISSPITYGFPAVTGFLGAFHAMSRKMAAHEALAGLSLGGVLLACYDCQPQIYRDNLYSNYTFNQSRNPIKKDGKTASIIEEGKCHLLMSFAVEVLADELPFPETLASLQQQSLQWIQQQRIAGGSVHGIDKYEPVRFVPSQRVDDIAGMLLPAFVLMDAQPEFAEIIAELNAENPNATPLDALIDVCSIHHVPDHPEQADTKWHTQSRKTGRGWLVPMPAGYQAIAPSYAAGVMQNVRNPEYPSQYVESIYSLGKWIYPQRLNSHDTITHAFWRYHHDADKGLYLVTQKQPN